MNIEELFNKVAEGNNINETIENLSKAIVLKYPSFNPNAIPSDYLVRQKAEKRPREYEVDVEQLKRLLNAYRDGKRFGDLYNQAIRVVAGNPDIFTNIVDFAKKAYGIEMGKKEEKKEGPKEEKPDNAPKEDKPVQKVREVRAKTENTFLKEVELVIKEHSIEKFKSENNIRFLNKFKVSFRKILNGIEKELRKGTKSKEEIAQKIFENFHNILLNVVEDENMHFDKRDIRLKLPNGSAHDFEVKSNSSKSKNAVLKYTQQFRISRSSSIKDLVADTKKSVIDVYNRVIEILYSSENIKKFTDKLNKEKNDLLTKINGNIVVVNKNDYTLIPLIAKSETIGNYILYGIRLSEITKYKTVKEWLNDL
jgi:hypothetical protein